MKLSDVAYSRENNFNLIRFLAAYAVLFSHCFVLVTGNALDEPLAKTLKYTISGMAVDVFFITSGFLITGSLIRRKSFMGYFRARALRIYPALFVVIFLSAFLLGPLLTTLSFSEYVFNLGTWHYLAQNMTILPFSGYQFLPGLYETNPYPNIVNGSLWTLPAELTSYIVVGFLWLLCCKLFKANKKVMTVFVAAISVSLLICFYLSKLGTLPPKNAYRLYFYFFAGSSMFMLAEHIALKHSFAFAAALLVGIGFIYTNSFHFIYTPLIGYLVLYCAYIPHGYLRKFNQAGDYSYGIYIYAFPVQQSLISLVTNISITEMILYTTIITLTCAVMSWHFIEKKALSYK